MPLFERENDEFRSDVGSQALSVIAIENDFVEGVYDKLASVYDLIFGPILHPGPAGGARAHRHYARRSRARSGSRHRHQCVAVSAPLPRHRASTFRRRCSRRRASRMRRKGLSHIRLMQMDAAALKFADDSFDIVYAPYS